MSAVEVFEQIRAPPGGRAG